MEGGDEAEQTLVSLINVFITNMLKILRSIERAMVSKREDTVLCERCAFTLTMKIHFEQRRDLTNAEYHYPFKPQHIK